MKRITQMYGIFGSVRILVSWIFTKAFYPSARLIRIPIDIRNKKLINFGKNLTTGFGCRIEVHPIQNGNHVRLWFGNNIQINDYVHIAAGEEVRLGDNVLIASKVFISDINHGSYSENSDSPDLPPALRQLSTSPVIIDDNVWIGESVCILPGVKIGKGSVIGSLSVVTKDIPPFSIAVGVPAKVIKQFNYKTEKWEAIKKKEI